MEERPVPTHPLEIEQPEEEVQTHEPAKVILFNDEVHTFEDVITQIIKAIRCAREKAEALTWEVHNSGRAIVYAGEMLRCVEVSAVLEEIHLMTQIEV
jgi:ATP-dependent Clp protease adapter protein ClpS